MYARGASFRNSIDALSPQRNHYCHRKAPIFSSVISVRRAKCHWWCVYVYTRRYFSLSLLKRNPWWWIRTNIVVSGGMGLIKDAFTALHPWLFRPALSSLRLSPSLSRLLSPPLRDARLLYLAAPCSHFWAWSRVFACALYARRPDVAGSLSSSTLSTSWLNVFPKVSGETRNSRFSSNGLPQIFLYAVARI